MGVYSAQYHQNNNDVSSIVENANGDDVFGCCSIVLQMDGNDSMMSLISNDSSINKSCLEEIQKIKKPYGRGHFVIKAPNGNYGFTNVDKLKTGTLEPGSYISIPNNYSLSRSGNLSLKSDNLIKDMNELSQLDKYGLDRRDIITYDFHPSANNNTTDVYVSNEDGSKLNVSYVDCVDDVYFNNQLTKAADIPIAPDYKSLGSIVFTDADLSLNNDNMVYIVLAVAVIFIIALSYGVYRLVRFMKNKFIR